MIAELSAVQAWAEFLTSVTFDDLPEEVVGRTKLAILDSLAVSGAGAGTPIAVAVEKYARSVDGGHSDDGPMIDTYPANGAYRDWELAGLVQGVRAYGHLYGDTSLRSVSHPGPVVVASALTTAQRVGASGRDVILAVALGYQILEAFAVALNGVPPRMALQVRGFRPTAVCGPLAAVATAGKLLGLDARQLANSLAIAASEAGGLRPNDGDPSAAILLQTGTAVRVGHAAIRLSEAGVRGHPRALEAPGGFLEAYSGRKTVPVTPDSANWAILGTAVKLHATAHTLAPVIDMMLRLRREHDLPLDRIERIVVIVPEAHIKISGGKKPMPATAADATANYPFGVAAALVDGDYLWPATVNRLLTDPAVVRLAALVEVRSDPTHTAEFDSGEKLWPATVEVVVDGKTLRATVDRPDGADYNPEAVAAVTRKFEALVTQWPTTVDAQAIRDYVMNMETADDFFAGLLAATARFGSDAMQLRS